MAGKHILKVLNPNLRKNYIILKILLFLYSLCCIKIGQEHINVGALFITQMWYFNKNISIVFFKLSW